MAMRIKTAMKAITPTTIPAMAPGLICLEAGSVVGCGRAPAVGDDVAPIGDNVMPVDNEALDDVDVELVFDVTLATEVDKNGAATRGFESRKPAAKSAIGQPLAHGLDSQHPMKGGTVPLQVYQLPEEHCWSGKVL